MLEGIGTISSYLQMKDLRLQAKTKLRTGKSLKEQQAEWRRQVTEQNLAAQKTKKKKDASDDTRTSIITQKLRRGQELSAEELKYLKEKDPDLYTKAKQAQETRAELQSALKRAKTKEEAQRAVAAAQLKVATQAMNESKYGSADAAMSGAMSAGVSPAGADAAAGTVADMGASGAADVSGVSAAAGATGISAAASAAAPEAGMPAPAAAGAETSAQGAASPAGAAAGVQDAASAALHGGEAANGLAAAAGKDTPQGAQALSERVAAQRAERLSVQQANRAAGLDQLESAKNAKPPVDEKYLYMFAAIQDEWKKFVGSKDYDALPESALDALDPEKDERRRRASGKASYRTTARQTLEAAERYRLQGNSDTAGGAAGALVDLSAEDAAGTPGRGY
ncbi:hypothetical protein [uncultured Selenomonas sp.]|uniref:hypothetical protein n=1 Tax=uncultured Selenomonas sp. TaxID=159275 RepID=UPI00280639DF|nr:hypothetical protein [uncultured Selenomonas sp.]